MLGYYVGAELVLWYSLLVKLIFIYFESVLESLQKTKVLFGDNELLDCCGEELLLWAEEHQLICTCRRLFLEQLDAVFAAIESSVHIQRGCLGVDELDQRLVLLESQLFVLVENRFESLNFFFGYNYYKSFIWAPCLITFKQVKNAMFYNVHEENANICSSYHKTLLNRLQ